MTDYTFHTLDNPHSQFVQTLRAALSHYNQSMTGEAKICNLGISANNATGQTVGAIYGWLQWGWMYIDLLWVEEAMRGQGIGSQLLRRLEDAALEQGIDRVRLDTGSFQAPDFYLRHGYSIYSELEITADNGGNHIIYSMKKSSIRNFRTARQIRPDTSAD